MGLRMIVDAFCKKARWVGGQERVYAEFRALLQDVDEDALNAKVHEFAAPGMKPWTFADKVRGVEEQKPTTGKPWEAAEKAEHDESTKRALEAVAQRKAREEA